MEFEGSQEVLRDIMESEGPQRGLWVLKGFLMDLSGFYWASRGPKVLPRYFEGSQDVLRLLKRL